LQQLGLCDSDLLQLERSIEVAATLAAAERDSPAQRDRKKAINTIRTKANNISNALANLDCDTSEGLINTAYLQQGREGLTLLARLKAELDGFINACDSYAKQLTDGPGAKKNHPKSWLAREICMVLEESGVEISKTIDGTAATVMKIAFEAAGMPQDDVRKYLESA
ncbi:MAG: hypothetical protein R3348_09760, partial [Xanthomonadales bacterium]|nr:hypothetical protein [Xanthomonadales bacterium]